MYQRAGFWADAEVISSYSRAQAIEDGVLIDAGGLAREAGFKWPVALTSAAWAECVTVPEGPDDVQDKTGRLWDVLNMLRFALRRGSGHEIRFSVQVLRNIRKREIVELRAIAGPGDHGERVITILLVNED